MATFSFYTGEDTMIPRLVTSTETIYFFGAVRVTANDSTSTINIRSQFGDSININSDNDTVTKDDSPVTGAATEIAEVLADYFRLYLNSNKTTI